jgi:Arc-like DNA binding domain
MTWRSDDELIERVRDAARANGRSMNDYVTAVLDAATNPDLAEGDAERLRARLQRAGLLASSVERRKRPSAAEVSRARAAAGRGTPLSELVARDR